MRFCANPRCRFHAFRVKAPGQPLVVNTPPASSVEACALKEIVHHHPYRHVDQGVDDSPVYFCDVCRQAIEMARHQRLKAVSGTGSGKR